MTLPGPFAPQYGEDLLTWAAANTDELRRRLRADGVVWLRGFAAAEADLAQQLLTQLGTELMDDVFFSTPRSAVAGKTYTATEYPADQIIPLHSEMAYLTRYPRLLCFHALVCPATGGHTTVADLDAVTEHLGDLPGLFHQRQVRYTRIFHPGLDIPLSTAFGADDPTVIAGIAQRHGMTLHDGPDDHRLVYTAQGALRDSVTGDLVWFNQASLHHPARLPADTRSALTSMYGAGGLPRQAHFGDGQPISDEIVRRISDALDANTQLIDWQPGDVVLVDNLRYLHGRSTFHGDRTVHVAMGMPCHGGQRDPLFS